MKSEIEFRGQHLSRPCINTSEERPNKNGSFFFFFKFSKSQKLQNKVGMQEQRDWVHPKASQYRCCSHPWRKQNHFHSVKYGPAFCKYGHSVQIDSMCLVFLKHHVLFETPQLPLAPLRPIQTVIWCGCPDENQQQLLRGGVEGEGRK